MKQLVRIATVLAVLVALALAVVGSLWWRFDSKLTRVEPDARAGFRWPYFLYIPSTARARGDAGTPLHLLVLPNNTGRGDDDIAVHERAAWWRAWRESSLADELEVVALVPVFPRPATNWQVYTHALDRDCLTTQIEELERLDLQLIAMIDDARESLAKQGWTVEQRVLLKGFSANGMFANRFTVLHPDRVLVAAIGSPGGWPIAPVGIHDGAELRYPLGVADIEELSGRPFDRELFARVPLFLYMGDLDTNDSLQFGDGYETQDKELVERVFGATPIERWDDSEAIYKAAGSRATFRHYSDVGHKVSKEMKRDLVEFLREILAEAR